MFHAAGSGYSGQALAGPERDTGVDCHLTFCSNTPKTLSKSPETN